jgi:hypothetical protein
MIPLAVLGASRCPSASASQPSECIQEELHRLRSTLDESPALAEGIVRARTIFTDEKLSPEDRARLAFESVFEARIAHLSPEDQEAMRYVKNDVVRIRDRFGLKAYWDYDRKFVLIKAPEKLQKSIVGYFILIHELEHALHQAGLSKLSRTFEDPEEFGRLWAAAAVDWRMGSENMAMKMEWTYLHQIPDVDRTEMIKQVRNLRRFDGAQKKFLTRVLSNSAHSWDEYLNAEHASGRYTKEEIERLPELLKNIDKQEKMLTLALKTGIVTTGASSFILFCTEYQQSRDFNPSNKLYQVLCSPVIRLESLVAKLRAH